MGTGWNGNVSRVVTGILIAGVAGCVAALWTHEGTLNRCIETDHSLRDADTLQRASLARIESKLDRLIERQIGG